MNPMGCRYEGETIRALRSGSADDELLRHQQSCPHCREALRMAAVLERDAAELDATCTPPRAVQIWAAAERRRRTAALERATLVLRALKASGMLYAVIFLVWGLRWLAGATSGWSLPGLDSRALAITLEGAGLAVLCVGTGLCYALRRDGRQVG